VNAASSTDLDAQFAQALADGVPLPVLDVLWQGIGEIGAEVTARLDAIERRISGLEQAVREADEGGWPG
jgi:hypothetical protein